MKKFIFTATVLAALTGCATNDYALYAEAQKVIAQSKAVSDTARYNALAEIARQGDTAAKIAAVMSLQMNSGSGSQQQTVINSPKSAAEVALQWTSVLLPNVTQLYSIGQSTRAALRQSDNSMSLGIAQSNAQTAIANSTNQAFVGIAGKIQAPQANVTTTTTDSSNRSVTNTTTDSSNRSMTSNTDSSNRSMTSNTDSSNRSVNTTTTTDSSNRSVNTATTTDTSTRPVTTNNSSNNTGVVGP